MALEYGFMKAMKKRVGLFRNADFRHDRADFSGKLAQTFVILPDNAREVPAPSFFPETEAEERLTPALC